MRSGLAGVLGGLYHAARLSFRVEPVVEVALAHVVQAVAANLHSAAALRQLVPGAGDLLELELSLATVQALTQLGAAQLQCARLVAACRPCERAPGRWRGLAASAAPGLPLPQRSRLAHTHRKCPAPAPIYPPPPTVWLSDAFILVGTALALERQMTVALTECCKVPTALQERQNRIAHLASSSTQAVAELLRPVLQRDIQASAGGLSRGWDCGCGCAGTSAGLVSEEGAVVLASEQPRQPATSNHHSFTPYATRHPSLPGPAHPVQCGVGGAQRCGQCCGLDGHAAPGGHRRLGALRCTHTTSAGGSPQRAAGGGAGAAAAGGGSSRSTGASAAGCGGCGSRSTTTTTC